MSDRQTKQERREKEDKMRREHAEDMKKLRRDTSTNKVHYTKPKLG